MAGFHRSRNWLIRTREGLIPRGIARPGIREGIEKNCRAEGKPLDNGDLAQYFATPYYVVKSWADRGVLPYHKTASGRARFRLTDVIALRWKRERLLEELRKEDEAKHTRERQRMKEILAEIDGVRDRDNSPVTEET